ncbi:hypothetical protein D3C76_1856770 [compost metagenome]
MPFSFIESKFSPLVTSALRYVASILVSSSIFLPVRMPYPSSTCAGSLFGSYLMILSMKPRM